MAVEYIAGQNVDGLALSEAVRARDLVFLLGLAGLGPDGVIVSGGVAAETDRIMLKVKDILQRQASGSRTSSRSMCILETPRMRATSTRLCKIFSAAKPVRTSAVAQLLSGGQVEVDVVAYGPKPTST